MMKRAAFGLVAIVAGLGIGAGGAWGVLQYFPQQLPHHKASRKGPTEFVPPVQMLAPLVFPDGRLAGYANFEIQLEVSEGAGEDVGTTMPLLMNAVNLRTYRTPLASGKDGLVPGLEPFRRVVMEAAAEVYGKDVVRSVAVTRASPG
ncbi:MULTISPECIES: hypothetical protein [Novosphingobium]|uniref:Flagellar basal body-associated protein FliL n=1 Tax=Novosphingobium panipatense TaxID=428991 RepID=A0ABY1QNF4_9SPHN|nr:MULTISPECIES: hypothetical protein [Novosphingobium]SMP76233.1 hypothetical protein SAMN06296065_10976 [Novosphingobium panipatense]